MSRNLWEMHRSIGKITDKNSYFHINKICTAKSSYYNADSHVISLSCGRGRKEKFAHQRSNKPLIILWLCSGPTSSGLGARCQTHLPTPAVQYVYSMHETELLHLPGPFPAPQISTIDLDLVLFDQSTRLHKTDLKMLNIVRLWKCDELWFFMHLLIYHPCFHVQYKPPY